MPDQNACTPALAEKAQFSTTFGRRPRMIKLVRRIVSEFHDEIVMGATLPTKVSSSRASRLAMAAHELVENALSYGPGGPTSFSITIDPTPQDPTYAVQLKTRNRADPEQQQTVCRMLRQLREAEDPLQFYLGLMAQTARRPTGSGLGLARVRVEADMHLSCVVDGEVLEIVAQVQFNHATDG